MLRSTTERLLQTLGFQLSAFALCIPAYGQASGAGPRDSLIMLAALTAACILWSPLHNFLWDLADLRIARRLASDRPHRWRIVHAVSHEGSSTLLTIPLLMILGGHGFWQALLLDIGLTVLCVLYAYLYFWAWDRLWPVRPTDPPHATKQSRHLYQGG